jgi:formylglycine-generating enzyme required for sulfatase activity/Flp pilus assembly protein TadD
MGESQDQDRSWIDGVADRFERAWIAGQEPRIEDYLAEAEGASRHRLLEELLRVERELRGTGHAPMAGEYRRRFPGDAAVVDAVFGAAPQGAAQGTEGNLLFAVIALQNNFIEQADLIAAFHTWAADKAQPLGEVLVARGAITRAEHALVEVLVGKHLKKHGGDVRATLGAVAGAAARDAIGTLDDAEVRNSLSSLPPAAGHVLIETVMRGTEEKRSRYMLTHLHADGGLGRVWLARDTELNREVALKEILPGKANHPELWRRFLKEAQVTGQLEHPNIVPVYELARRPEDDQPFYTMRFVRGRTLRQAIADFHTRRAQGQAEPLERPRLLQAFVSVCQAIAYAHSRGVIHRDLKPDNVVLGGFGEVIVLDWGLAKKVDHSDLETDLASVAISDEAEAEATREGQRFGTPAYMAPEQAEGHNDLIDGRTDIYGLGAILFEILTGRAPHQGQTIIELLERIATGATPRARSAEPSVPAALDAICGKAMARLPDERYAEATELAEDVQRWLADEPVSAWREPWTVRARRWRARHRPLVASAATALVVMLMAATWGTARDRTRGSSLAQAILAAEIGKVPPLVEQLEGYRAWADPLLVAHLKAEPDDSSEELRAALAMVPVDARQVDYLCRRLLKATAEELLVIRSALKPFGHTLKTRLWAMLDDSKAEADLRLRAAAALAAFDPDDRRWQAQSTAIVDRLVKEDPQVLRFWTEAFRPARSNLIKQLAATFQNQSRSEAERTLASNLLLAYADRPEDLADLVQSADPQLFGVLVARLARSPAQAQVVSHLQQALAQTLEPRWNDPPLDPAWAPPDPALVMRIDQAQGLLAERFAFCQTMPLAVFAEVAEGLRRSGYRPIRLRPYRAAETVRVAAVWTRDGRPWQMVHGVDAETLRQNDADWQRQGYRPVDVAGFMAADRGQGPNLVYAAIWAKRLGPDDLAQLDLDLTHVQFEHVRVARGKQGFVIDSTSIVQATDGLSRSCAVWVRGKPGRQAPDPFIGSPLGYYAKQQDGSKLQVDVSLGPEPPQNLKDMHTAALARAEQAVRARPNDPSGIEARGRARFYLDQFEGAVADLTRLVSLKKISDQTFLLRSRCYAHLGKPAEAKRDFAEYLHGSNKSIRDDPEAAWADAAIACQLGQDTEGLKRLEVTLAAHPGNTQFLFHAAWAYAEASRTITTRGYGDRAVQLLQEAVANGFNTHNDFVRIRVTPELEPVRSHPGYRALMFPAGLGRQFAGIWSESKTLESEVCDGLVPAANLERCREWAAQGYRPAATAVASAGNDLPLVTASVWHRPRIAPEARRALVERQGQAAAALVQLGRPELVWPLLRLAPDPSLRTEVIHNLARFDSGARAVKAISARLETEPDASARSALILTLGEFPATAITAARQPLTARLLGWYRNDPDPGVHSAVDWLLRQKWGQAGELDRLDREFSGMSLPTDRNWYVNTEGQTLAIVRGPALFSMGSPSNEAGRYYDETQHLVRIGRSFAIATREVTDAEFKRSIYSGQSTNPLLNAIPRVVSWGAAARYCNWLSQQEQIPEDQWCYPRQIEAGMTLPSDYLERTGYRLPTEAEWECACRAGTTTSRPLGSGDRWLDRYVWCYETSRGDYSGRPVGQLKPNDLGLFDILGNMSEWVQDPFDLFILDPNGRARTDSEIAPIITDTMKRIARGGHISLSMKCARSAYRYPEPGTGTYVGFRVARTYHPQDLDTVIARYREAIRHQPEDLSAHVNLGLVLSTGGRLDAAIVEYREAIRLDPDRDASYDSLAGVLYEKGNVREMVAVLQQAVERRPDNPQLRHHLALSLLLAGDREDYRRACAAMVQRFGRATGVSYEASRAYLLVPEVQHDLSAGLRKVEASPGQGSPAFSYVQGLAHYRAGQHEQAIRVLSVAMETYPHWPANALTRLVLAMAHHRLGHAEEARRWLEKAHDPRGGEVYGLKPGELISAARPYWWDRGDYQILRREADELILGSVLPAKPPAP